MNRRLTWTRTAGGLGISGVFLWLALRSLAWDQFFGALRGADYRWIAAATIVQIVAIVSRSERWRQILEAKVRSSDALLALGVGYLFTNIMPLRIGEVARMATLSAKGGLPVVQVGAATVVERLLDVACVLLMLTVLVPFVAMPRLVTESAGVFAAAVAVSAIVLLLLVRKSGRFETVLERVAGRLLPHHVSSITPRWGELLAGFRGAATAKGKIAGLSVLTWCASVAVYWCVIRAFEPLATVVEAAFMVGALALAISVPSAPGFVGVFQWAGQQALVVPFGGKYDPSTAMAITVSAHLVYYIFTSGLGLVAVWRLGESAIGSGLLSRLFSRGRIFRRAPSTQAESDRV